MPFEWDGKELATLGQLHDAVLDILRLWREYGVDTATEFIDDYGTWLERVNPGLEDGRQMARSNIGYIAGYEDDVTKHVIFTLFDCEHPIFGRTDPTPEEAFEAGKNWVRNSQTVESE